MGNVYSEMFPPAPTLTEKNLPDQSGKVFIVTGSSSGVGQALAGILYQHNAKVYVAARSAEKADKAISAIKSEHPDSKGQLVFLKLDLDDLTTIKGTVDDFLSKESRLDVLFNNAGVMMPPQGSKTKQNWDLQLGTNNIAPFLFTKLLLPLLAQSAKTAPKDGVRVVWVSSFGAKMAPTIPIDMSNINYENRNESIYTKYYRSKAGIVFHSSEFARRTKGDGVIHVALNPGNLKTELQRHVQGTSRFFQWMLYTPIHGAYTELYAGLSPEITEENNGGWLNPWGSIAPLKKNLQNEDLAKQFYEWTDEQVKHYA